eukprot:scaffold8353_cov138-Cylindrotheca_fusiformis.AAC.13
MQYALPIASPQFLHWPRQHAKRIFTVHTSTVENGRIEPSKAVFNCSDPLAQLHRRRSELLAALAPVMGGRRDIFHARIGTSFEAVAWRSLDPCGLLGLGLISHGKCHFPPIVHTIRDFGARFSLHGLVSAGVSSFNCGAIQTHLQLRSTDPGAVPMGARPLVTVKRAPSGELKDTRQRAIRRCHKCNDNFKPNRAHHDSVTGSPWIGNAVGALNHKMFCLFVFYTMWSCIFSLVLIVLKALACKSPFVDPGDDVLPSCKSWHQNWSVEAIRTNSSKIARMKMKVGQAGTELSRVTEEFNEMFGGESSNVAWHWFLPLSVEFPRGMKKVVLGFEWDETFNPTPYVEHQECDLEQGRIELTTPPLEGYAKSEDDEEGTFSGSSSVNGKPRTLTRRASSSERVAALTGSLT